MPRYEYVAFSSSGRKSKGTIEASSPLEARRKLKSLGLSISNMRESTIENASIGRVRWTILGSKLDYARLFSDLSVLMNAGLSIDQAVRAARDASNSHGRRSELQHLLDRMTAGASPSVAFAPMPALPVDALALIVSGERVGHLAHVMKLIGEELTRRQSRRKELIDALIYPVFLLLMMTFAIGILSFVLVPSLEPIFESSDRSAPIILLLLGHLRRFLSQPFFVAGFLAVAGLLSATAIIRPTKTKLVLGSLALRIPLVGTIISQIAIARYLQNLALLIDNAVAVPDALKIAADGCAISSYRQRLYEIRDDVMAGKSVHSAFAAVDIMPTGTVSLVAIGDEVNRLGPVLSGAAGALTLDAQRTLARATTLLTPVITITLGALVGSLVISVMSALLSVNELGM